MRLRILAGIAFGAACALLATSITPALSQGQATLFTDKATGLIVKVVAGSNKIKAYAKPDGASAVFDLELLEPYFVMEESGAYYKITTSKGLTVEEALKGQVGYVKQDQVHKWPTREALHFSPLLGTLEARLPIKGWEDKEKITRFFDTGDETSYGPSFQEDIKSSLKREKGLRPYPVIGTFKAELRKTKRFKSVYNVLLPATVPPGTVVAVERPKGGGPVSADQLEGILRKVTFGVVFDATGSMDKYAKETAAEINGAIRQLSKEAFFKDTRVGFVYFRDRGDEEKARIVPPLPVDEAATNLMSLRTYGGGDDAEPVLDALYLAADFFDWDAGESQSGARKAILAVVNADAHPTTQGLIDRRVPAGLTADKIAKKLLDQGIIVIAVQAGAEAGPNLLPMMRTIGEGTGGISIPWPDRGAKDLADHLGVQIKNSMLGAISKEKSDARKVAEVAVASAGAGSRSDKLVLPLSVLDAGMLDRLRRAGLNLNIDDKAGGIIVTEGFIPENTELMEEQVLVEKQPLQDLLGLFTALSITPPDGKDLVETAQNTISVMAGEKIGPKDKLDDIARKKTGLTFRTDMLKFDLEWFGALTPVERLSFQKRIQETSNQLASFMEANSKEFDRLGSIWMRTSLLP